MKFNNSFAPPGGFAKPSYGNPTGFNYNFMKNNVVFSQKNLAQITKSNNVIIQNKISVNENPPAEDGRSRWGPSIWYLFHTLSFKIKEEEFSGIRAEILDIIKVICKNLPCPSCANHATAYMQRLDYNSIQSKDDFKRFFFNFHNDVNKRLEKPIFSLEDLENKYGSANTFNIIKNFMLIFQYKSQSFNMIANDMQRQRQIDLMKVWFNNNVQKFDN